MSTLVDFMSVTPPPLALHLLPLAPLIHRFRLLLDILLWSTHWEESALLLPLWWSLCLFADLTLKFFLPFAALFVFALRHCSSPAQPPSTPPVTETTVHVLVDDLAAIHALLPLLPRPAPVPRTPPHRRLSLPPIPPPHSSRPPPHLHRHLRHPPPPHTSAGHSTASTPSSPALLSPLHPPLPLPNTPPALPPGTTEYTDAPSHPDGDPSAPRPSPPLRFLFTVYENQRWWVGLDWTAALLPGERPSWCSASQVPLPPPSTFSLPSPTASFVPVGKHGRAKRIARWTWEEPEWRVVIRKEGHDGLWRIEKTPTKDKDTPDDTGTAARILRPARGRDSSRTGSSESPERDKKPPYDHHLQDPYVTPAHEDDILTDPEGWVYGDNKWEGASCKGGMGKYTRYRRWTRIAILTETVELVGPGEFGVMRGLARIQRIQHRKHFFHGHR
ncbi:integral peroxisomal membrane peroxin-domain-containing protein [Lanmaoa asiatica]|nr:integral peroxisomal membrane peroxin-domain-containing protein [Lanmaoa asiatica]